jgi:hypothetical protein
MLRGISLADFDKEVVEALRNMPESVQRKILLEILVKRELKSNIEMFSEIFTSKLNRFQKWIFKSWTGFSVSPTMFETRSLDTPESNVDQVIILLSKSTGK